MVRNSGRNMEKPISWLIWVIECWKWAENVRIERTFEEEKLEFHDAIFIGIALTNMLRPFERMILDENNTRSIWLAERNSENQNILRCFENVGNWFQIKESAVTQQISSGERWGCLQNGPTERIFGEEEHCLQYMVGYNQIGRASCRERV